MAGHRPLEDTNRQCRARPFAKAQAKLQQWFLVDLGEQSRMRPFRALCR